MVQPEELCNKTGERVMDMLCTKHPDARPSYAASLDTYMDQTLELIPVDITKDKVTEVAGRLSGGARLVGTDSVSL